jgi:hypothetical protein
MMRVYKCIERDEIAVVDTIERTHSFFSKSVTRRKGESGYSKNKAPVMAVVPFGSCFSSVHNKSVTVFAGRWRSRCCGVGCLCEQIQHGVDEAFSASLYGTISSPPCFWSKAQFHAIIESSLRGSEPPCSTHTLDRSESNVISSVLFHNTIAD